MKRFKFGILIVLAIAFGFVNPVHASTIDPFSTWYEFSFTYIDLAPSAMGCTNCTPSSGGNSTYAPDPSWDFTASQAFTLIVTDAFVTGDAFNVYDYGKLIGVTSVPTIGTITGISDPQLALLDPNLSHGYFQLSAGSHSITIDPYQVLVPGAAYFTAVDPAAPIPEPTTLILLGSGLVGLVAFRRKPTRT